MWELYAADDRGVITAPGQSGAKKRETESQCDSVSQLSALSNVHFCLLTISPGSTYRT